MRINGRRKALQTTALQHGFVQRLLFAFQASDFPFDPSAARWNAYQKNHQGIMIGCIVLVCARSYQCVIDKSLFFYQFFEAPSIIF